MSTNTLGWNGTSFIIENNAYVNNGSIYINNNEIINSQGQWKGVAGNLARTNYNYGIISEVLSMNGGEATYDNFDAMSIDRQYPLYLYPGISTNKSTAIIPGVGFNYYHHPNNIPIGTVFQGADNSSNNTGVIDGINFSLFTNAQSHFGIRFIVEVHRPKLSLSGLGTYKIEESLVKIGVSEIIDSTTNGFSPLSWIEDTNCNSTSAVLSNYLTTNIGTYNSTTKVYEPDDGVISGIHNWNSSSLGNSYYVSYVDSNISPYLSFSANGNINKGETISISIVKYTNYNYDNTAITSNLDFYQILATPFIRTTSDDVKFTSVN